MSLLMSNCDGCGYLIPKESACPNCRHSKTSENDINGKAVDVIEEFARRRAIHNRNSANVMCAKMTGGFFALLASGGALFGRIGRAVAGSHTRLEPLKSEVEGSFINYGGIATIGADLAVLMIFVVIYVWFKENADSLFPVALCCPECEERLDQLGLTYDKCPACFAQLTR